MTAVQASLAPVGHLVCKPGTLTLGQRSILTSFLTWDYFFPNLDCEDFIFSVTVRKCAREVVRDTGERSRSFTLMQFV